MNKLEKIGIDHIISIIKGADRHFDLSNCTDHTEYQRDHDWNYAKEKINDAIKLLESLKYE